MSLGSKLPRAAGSGRRAAVLLALILLAFGIGWIGRGVLPLGRAARPVGSLAERRSEPGLSPRERPFSLPLNNPGMVPAASAAHMRPRDLIVGVLVQGRARAYPWWVLRNYHVVNDTLTMSLDEARVTADAVTYRPTDTWEGLGHDAYLPLLLTLCEVCAGASAYVPMGPHGRPLVFHQVRSYGAPGDYNAVGTYTICDLDTRSRWHPFTGRAMSGPLAGARLRRLPVYIDHWEDWVRAHPQTTVVDAPEELRRRAHARHPMDDLYRDVRSMHPSAERAFSAGAAARDTRLPDHELVLGVGSGDGRESAAWVLAELAGSGGLAEVELGGQPYLLIAIDPTRGFAFKRQLESRLLQFRLSSAVPFRLVDDSGSLWNEWGEAISGPLAGRRLEAAEDAYVATWIEWSQAHPGAELFRPEM